MSDQVIYETSMMNTIESVPFVRKENVYVIDSNNNSYSGGSVIIDTSSFSNSGKFADYKSAYIQIPLVMRLELNSSGTPGYTPTPEVINAIQASMSLGLKNGSWQIIQSMSCDLNNTNIIQLQPFISQYVTFKILSQMSQDDLKKYGDSIGFQPDTGYAVRYNSDLASHPEGHGSINNLNAAPQNTAVVPEDDFTYNDGFNKFAFNEGYKKRQATTGFNPTAPLVSQFTSVTQTGQMGQDYYTQGTIGQADQFSKYWLCTLTLRLKDIASFFEEIPLARGLFFRFTLNLNLAQHTIRYLVDTTTPPNYSVVDTSVVKNNLIGGSSPLIIASALPYNGMRGMVTGVAADYISTGGAGNVETPFEFDIAMSIGRDNKYAISCPWFTSCRLYVDLYQLAPSAEQQYISLNKAKQITYRDVYSYQIDLSSTTTGGDVNVAFSNLLTNGIVNPKGLLIIAYAGSSSNPVSKDGLKLEAYQSPFAAEPSTPTPFIKITNFQVQVGAQNVFQQNERYSWENWLEETSRIYAVNGAQITGTNSGLISYKDYLTNYGYIYVDLERRLIGENSVPKSIQVSGNVLSGNIQNTRLMCFVEFERTIAINPSTGERLD